MCYPTCGASTTQGINEAGGTVSSKILSPYYKIAEIVIHTWFLCLY